VLLARSRERASPKPPNETFPFIELLSSTVPLKVTSMAFLERWP